MRRSRDRARAIRLKSTKGRPLSRQPARTLLAARTGPPTRTWAAGGLACRSSGGRSDAAFPHRGRCTCAAVGRRARALASSYVRDRQTACGTSRRIRASPLATRRAVVGRPAAPPVKVVWLANVNGEAAAVAGERREDERPRAEARPERGLHRVETAAYVVVHGERAGFEPANAGALAIFRTAAFNRSATSPLVQRRSDGDRGTAFARRVP